MKRGTTLLSLIMIMATAPLILYPENDTKHTTGELIVEIAKKYIGTPYRYGSGGQGAFDCSGFTAKIYGDAGIPLPHSAMAQFDGGFKIDLAAALPGDLVFFKISRDRISHVGIFLGEKDFIHAPSSGKKVMVSSMDIKYWKIRYAGAVTYLRKQ